MVLLVFPIIGVVVVTKQIESLFSRERERERTNVAAAAAAVTPRESGWQRSAAWPKNIMLPYTSRLVVTRSDRNK